MSSEAQSLLDFPISEADPVQFPGPPPAFSEVVIIGGGIIGITTALFLAKKGVAVAVVEKGRVAAEQSSRNWGWIRKQGRDADELPIVIEATRLWKQLAEECGEDIGLTRCGVTYLARTDKEMDGFDEFMPTAAAHELDTQLLEAHEVQKLIPGMARRFAGAITTPSDMRAEPWVAVSALARLASRLGVRIVENCAARALDVSAGAVSRVWTEAGSIRTSTVLVAGGAWSSLFLRKHGVSIPQLSVRSTVAASEPLPEIYMGAAADNEIAFRRRQDGGYTLAAGGQDLYLGPDAFRHAIKYIPAVRSNPLGTRYHARAPAHYPDGWSTPRDWTPESKSPFERIRVLNPSPSSAKLNKIKRNFVRLFPQFKALQLKANWAGMIDAMPDVVPILDRVAVFAGCYVATGMSGHGFGIGPGVGRVMADMILGGNVGHDLSRFRLARFEDGSPLRLGPSL
jgi:glycine/D-amino acid oxidase-like deaminating enzyme